MQVIAAAPPVTMSARLALARSALVATLLVAAGASMAWLFLATPIIGEVIPDGRPTTLQVVVGVLVWIVAIVVPAGLLLMGVARTADTLELAFALRRRGLSPAVRAALGPDMLAAMDLRIPGGRRVHELVLGPFGIVVLGEVPPPSVSRHSGPRWEVRDGRGRWIPIEGPLDRAARDAERIRSWLTSDDRDFLVRVYAAVVTGDPRIERTPSCAVVAPGAVGAWLAALPSQRGLTEERRLRLAALVREVAAGRATAG
jgi:hypothetical protein